MDKLSRVIVLSALLLLGVLNAPLPPTMQAAPQADFDCTAVTEIPQTECEALVALYNATDGENWTNSTDWLLTDMPCSWYGVTCTTGNVSLLSLATNQLSGAIPPEIGSLTALQELELGNNELSGTIPSEIGNLTALQSLYLYSNQLSGAIPPEIGDITTLQYLDLSTNQFNGIIPSEIGRLILLTYLHLPYNQLSGGIPPEIGNLTALQNLCLSYNQLSGTIPPEIGNLIALWMLDLGSNQLNGAIPSEIGALIALQELILSDNQLSGAIPPEIGNLTALQQLYLHYNQLSGAIPPEIGNLAALHTLYMGNNQLSAPIPPEFSNLIALQRLDLSDNLLTGAIPSEIGNLTALIRLALGNNQLNGTIPSEIGNLIALQELILYGNQLNGVIPPEFGNLTALQWLYLTGNQLSGGIPQEIGNLTALQGLYLSYNQLSGAIPPQIGNLTALQGLYLYSNQLSGAIPPEIGNLVALQTLDLSSNQLDGTIPLSITNLTTLNDDWGADLAYNKLTSTDPTVVTFLNAKDPDWAATQTVPPTNLTASPSNYSVLLTWTPITYTGDGGYYEISYADPIFGFPVVHGTTADKGASSYLVDGLLAVPYLFGLRTYTPAHGDQQNALWSEHTQWVLATPTAPDPGSISGYVFKADGSTVITDTLISVHAHGITPDSSSLGTYVSQADGSYTISGLAPGTYKVQVNNNREPGYVSKYYDNKYTWDLADTIEITAGQTISGIDFALEPGGTIRGTVLKEGGGVITDVQLYVGAGTGTGIFISAPISQVDGSYELTGLPDGAYRVEANFFTLGYDRKFYDNVYRWDLATLVTIAGGNTVSDIDFALGPGGGISGHVYAADGVTPVEGVCVNVSFTAPDFNQVLSWGSTGSDGSFSFGGVPVGDVYIRTHASCSGGNTGYLDEWYADGGSVIDGNDATPVQIVAGQYSSDIDFTLDPAGFISGYVFKADGSTVITDVLISVHAFGITPGSSSLGTYVSRVDGSYTISGLAPGTYKVQANNNRALGYVSKYYDNKYTWDTADTIEVVAGQATSGIDFTLEPDGSISGMVTEQATGEPLSGVGVCVWVYDTGEHFFCVSTASDGTYVLPSLTSGDYRIRASQSGYSWQFFSGTMQWDDATRVAVTTGQVTSGINFLMKPGGSISGVVYNSDGTAPLAGIKVEIVPNNGTGWPACTDASGHYVLDVVPYDVAWRVRAVSSGDNWCGGSQDYITEYWQEAVSWDDATLLTLNATTSSYDGVNFTLDIGGSISGIVYQADGITPIPNAWINVMDSQFQSVAGGHSQADGSYLVGGLGQGSYYLAVQAEGFGGVYYPNGYDDPGAVLVPVVVPEITPDINFTLAPEATLSGFVYESDGVTPISGARVSVWPQAGGQVRAAFADSTGAYTVPGLSTGLYVAKAEANGFETEYCLNAYDWSTATAISVTQPNNTSGITFTLSLPSSPPPLIEKQALEALYNSTNGSQWLNSDGWMVAPSPCTWYGVTCFDGHIVSIVLTSNQLSGTIPSEIGSLLALTDLQLPNNQLGGTIPPEIGSLTTLRTLYLNNNQLTGIIPPEFGNLIALQYLALFNNQLSGAIPSEIGDLTALQMLSLGGNQLTSLPSEISNLIALRILSLGSNQLTNLPPGIGNLTALTRLSLWDNKLTSLPPEIGSLTTLQGFFLGANQITNLPPEIGNLAALQWFDISDNPLSGELPVFLASLNLNTFAFYDTDLCAPSSGNIFTWLSGIPALYGTGYICGQALGSLSGTVALTDTTPAVGVQVNLYRSLLNQWQAVSSTQTIADGTYQFANLGQGIGIDYRVQFVDPSNQVAPQYYVSKPTISTADVITITPGVPRTGIDAVMALPQPPVAVVDPGDGSVVYNPDGTAEITMPAPTPSDITVTRAVTCSGSAIIPISVTLQLSTGPQYSMAGVGGDLYQATVPASDLAGNATLSVIAVCESGSSTTVVGYVTLYDPSGIIRDTRTGLPVKGAKVTLYQVPGWLPKAGPDDTRPNTCESNLSKPADVPWSQPAPTDLGIIANAEVTPLAPKLPYQETTAEGYYGWDVSEGCWYVTVEADGYEPLVSPVVGIPPEVTDLHLALTPLGGVKIFLPLVLRQF